MSAMRYAEPTKPGAFEYALMIEWDSATVEFVRAKDAAHAQRMAETIYAGHASWTVARVAATWRYVRVETREVLATEVTS